MVYGTEVDRNGPAEQSRSITGTIAESFGALSRLLDNREHTSVLICCETISDVAAPDEALWTYMPPFRDPLKDIVEVLKLGPNLGSLALRRRRGRGN